jgi:hypothetical protein
MKRGNTQPPQYAEHGNMKTSLARWAELAGRSTGELTSAAVVAHIALIEKTDQNGSIVHTYRRAAHHMKYGY